MPSKIETEFYRNCPGCNKIIYYTTARNLLVALKRDLPCHSCGIKAAWSDERKKEYSDRLSKAKLDPNSIYNTKEVKQKVSDKIKLAHKNPNFIWNNSEWLKSVSERNISLVKKGEHPFQNREKEFYKQGKEKAKITRDKPDSKWKRRIDFRNSPKGFQQASVLMKKARMENEVFHSEEYKIKINNHLIEARKLVKKKKISKDERKLLSILNKVDSGFILNEFKYNIGRFYPDIINFDHKIIIEYYGNYVHSNPNIYAAGTWNAVQKKEAKEVWKFDEQRKIFLEKEGWIVFIVWEFDFKLRQEEIISKIIEILK